ncbi:LuxR family transcriptional regulator [Actinocorallia sp. API 0066]|uniref:helix-turn-helix transcriptional regulator n=1 Tax=Actinocorallia sp. API 0066 TaxID=2896846 RepID=UPI001E31483D|nr:LuxR family transcriptional regulator [Actinocorallia sp. API 0066]MCD0449840.1 LuxR family transcriptional regulator [Actinocorallia sp. API 0066]
MGTAFAAPVADRIAESTMMDLVRTGRPDEAVRTLELLERAGRDPGGALRDWVAVWYPERTGPPVARGGRRGFDVLRDLLATGARGPAVRGAEEVLGTCPMEGDALESLTAALAALVYADRADLAARWSQPLLEQTTAHCDPVWLGLFAAVRGETLLRQGDPAAAAECVRTALSHIPWQDWGVAIGIPLGTMIAAKTALGMTECVIRYLAVPIPEAVFQTPAGLHYRAARAEFRRTSGNVEQALADYRECGALMRRWNIDLPGLVAWRIGAGEALLALGRPAEAAALAREHLELVGSAPSRTRGLALRLLALSGPAEQRNRLLEEASAVLRETGDPREVDHTGRETTAAPPTPPARALLSDAEYKVAELAARGLSNRQISSRLYITVSTVEQHLTRIYRKLGATRRNQLPEFLETVPR